jgi:predicted RND superfamily exporter protein
MVYHPEAGFRPLVEEVRAALPAERFTCIFTGTAVNTVLLSEGLVGGITRGLTVAALAMSVLCAVLFRSVRMTLIASLPNAFPLVVVFGLMGAFGVPLNSGSAMVTTVALGVALNSTIHFVMCYRRHRLEGSDKEQALSDTFGEIGRPIVLTSVVNCLGFGIFLLADFRPMHHFGLLAGIAMAAALVGDLILLPNLLKLFDTDREPCPVKSGPELAKATAVWPGKAIDISPARLRSEPDRHFG